MMQKGKTAHIVYEGSQYDLSKSGYFVPKYTLYLNGSIVGELTHSFWGSNGTISFAKGKSYGLRYKNDPGFCISFTENNIEFMRYTTQPDGSKRKMVLQMLQTILGADELLLMAALGMYLFTNMYNESTDDDATTLLLLTAN